MVYNAQLGVTIDKLEQALKPILPQDPMPDDIVPGRNRYAAQCMVYEYNLSKAYDWWEWSSHQTIPSSSRESFEILRWNLVLFQYSRLYKDES